jgi:hypothetical protein
VVFVSGFTGKEKTLRTISLAEHAEIAEKDDDLCFGFAEK